MNQSENEQANNDKNSDFIIKIIDDIKNDLSDDEIVRFLLDKKNETAKSKSSDTLTLGQRAADAVANFVGSWNFILCFLFMLVLWIIFNLFILSKAVDPYPFILLNLILSMIAAIQAPLVMMSQKRQEEKDRQRSEDDYRVNLKTEIIIEDLHQKIEELTIIQHQLRDISLKVEKETQIELEK